MAEIPRQGAVRGRSRMIAFSGPASGARFTATRRFYQLEPKIENGKRGIRVNAIAPGAIDTPMLQTAAAQSGSSAEAAASVLSLFNRLGKPEEVAQASLWLASDLSSFVTGATLAVDAGYSNR